MAMQIGLLTDSTNRLYA